MVIRINGSRITTDSSAVQAKSLVPNVTVLQAAGADQMEAGKDTGHPQVELDQLTDAGEPAAEQAPQAKDENQAAVSSAVQETQFRNLAAGLPYEWSEAPEASHPDDGYKLTDGKYGALDMNDPAWVGHLRGKAREVVFDLGEEKSIERSRLISFKIFLRIRFSCRCRYRCMSPTIRKIGALSHNATRFCGEKDRPDRRPLNGMAAGWNQRRE